VDETTSQYGPYSVTLKAVRKNEYYVERTLQVCCEDGQKEVVHMQLTCWPDRGIPDNVHGILKLIGRTKKLQRELTGASTPTAPPILVHCR
jgi:protein tyrosine phosphatase